MCVCVLHCVYEDNLWELVLSTLLVLEIDLYPLSHQANPEIVLVSSETVFSRAAVACVGAFYEKMGRMLGSAFPETVNNLLKSLKSAEVSLQQEFNALPVARGKGALFCRHDPCFVAMILMMLRKVISDDHISLILGGGHHRFLNE